MQHDLFRGLKKNAPSCLEQINWQAYLRWAGRILADLEGIDIMTLAAQDAQRANGQKVTGPRLRNLLVSVAPCSGRRARSRGEASDFEQHGFELGRTRSSKTVINSSMLDRTSESKV